MKTSAMLVDKITNAYWIDAITCYAFHNQEMSMMDLVLKKTINRGNSRMHLAIKFDTFRMR